MMDFFRPTKGSNENAGTIMLVVWMMFTAVFILSYFVSVAFDSVLGNAPWQSLTVSFSSAIPVLGLALVAPIIYKRPVLTLITTAQNFRMKLFGLGAAIWGGLLVVGAAVSYASDPGSFSLVFDAASFVPMLLVCLILIPIQVGSEELLYRGVLAQAFGRAFRSDVVVIGLTTTVFALPHLLNPEAAGDSALAFVAYGAISFGWVMAARQFGGLEIALGAHLVNNFFGILIVGYSNAVVDTSPIWLTPVPEMGPTAIASVVTVTAWLVALRFVAKRQPRISNLTD